MANRTMAQKRIKLMRQKRAWANSLRGRGMMQPNRELIRMYADHARGLEDREFVDSMANALGPAIAARKEALKKQGEFEAWLPKDCNLRFAGPGPNIPGHQECMSYTNSRKDCFVVVHRDIKSGIERRSTTYSSKELLTMCWELDTIVWVYKAPIGAVSREL